MVNGRKKRVTHREVAERANVSTAVVSYVINEGPRATSPETRERVLRAIKELDYHPNATARSLRAQQTQTIGFITHDLQATDIFVSTYIASILTGVITNLKSHNRYLMVYPQVIDETLGALERLLRSGRLDGVMVRLIQDAPITDSLMEMIASTGIPCVCIERPCAPRFNFSAVTYDDTAGARMATHHLIERGHRHIAHLSGDGRYASAQARLEGYRQALTEASIALDPRYVRGNDWNIAVVATSIHDLFELDTPPTAIFAASDDLALAALSVLRTRGLRVPEDVALVGFDDIAGARESTPPLTTLRIPLVELGVRAADLVRRLSDGDTTVASEIVPVELMIRATT